MTKVLLCNLLMLLEVLDLWVKIAHTKLLYDVHEIHQVIVNHQTITITHINIFKNKLYKKNVMYYIYIYKFNKNIMLNSTSNNFYIITYKSYMICLLLKSYLFHKFLILL